MTRRPPLRIGIDFDNTIVSYDLVFTHYALEKGWIAPGPVRGKKAVRAEVMSRHSNEEWTELQGLVYGEGLARAEMYEGFRECAGYLQSAGAELFIVSLKTEFAARGVSNLRASAYEWLETKGFFSPEGLGLDRDRNIFFENSLPDKLRRIAALKLTHFVDDHLDVLLDPAFDPDVLRLHFNPAMSVNASQGSSPDASFLCVPDCRTPQFWGMAFPSWQAIQAYFRQVE